MRGGRTGLVVLVPEAEDAVGELRRGLDPMARLGVPAHITVLFPFVPAESVDADLLARLAALFAREPSFVHDLTATDWFGDDVLWLASSAEQRFRQLTVRAVAAFPAYLPYGGAFDDVVPHLTVADRAALEAMRAAEQQVRPALPIRSHARAVTLMVEQPSGRWAAAASFAMAR